MKKDFNECSRALLALGSNCNSDGALPIDAEAAVIVRSVLNVLGPPTELLPLVDGGIQIVWNREGVIVELETWTVESVTWE